LDENLFSNAGIMNRILYAYRLCKTQVRA